MPRQPLPAGVTRFKLRLCPQCGYPFDAMTDSDRHGARTPQAGDLAICLNCADVSRLGADGITQHALSAEDQAAFDRGDEDWRDVRRLVERIKRCGIPTRYAEQGPGRAH